MNGRVIISLVMAVIWLGIGVYFLVSERVAFAFADSKMVGWLAMILVLWNVLRAGLTWSKPRRTHEPPF
jgi:hypothetical protein